MVFLQIGRNKTTPKYYSTGDYIVGSWSAYVRMDAGEIIDVEWVDGCRECSAESEQCIGGVCGVEKGKCTSDDPCNMKFFVGWIGTDMNNRAFQRFGVWGFFLMGSAGKLPEYFRALSFESVFEDASGKAAETLS